MKIGCAMLRSQKACKACSARRLEAVAQDKLLKNDRKRKLTEQREEAARTTAADGELFNIYTSKQKNEFSNQTRAMRQILKGEREYADFNSNWTANKEATMKRRAERPPKSPSASKKNVDYLIKVAATKDQAKIAHLTATLAESRRQLDQLREEKDKEIDELKKLLKYHRETKKKKKVKMVAKPAEDAV